MKIFNSSFPCRYQEPKHIWRNLYSTAGTDFRPNHPFKMVTFSTEKRMFLEQQTRLTRTLERLAIDCVVSEELSFKNQFLSFGWNSYAAFLRFKQQISEQTADVVAGSAGVGVDLRERVEAALHDWISIDSRLCKVILRGTFRASSHCPEGRNLFVVSACSPADCSSAVLEYIYEKLNDFHVRQTGLISWF